MDHLARLLSTLADPTRLRALALLMEHDEVCACGMSKALLITPARINGIIKAFDSAGLIGIRHDPERDPDCRFLKLTPHESLTDDQRIVVSMLRCLLPGERVADAEERLQAWIDERRRIGKKCVVCCCKEKGANCNRPPKMKR